MGFDLAAKRPHTRGEPQVPGPADVSGQRAQKGPVGVLGWGCPQRRMRGWGAGLRADSQLCQGRRAPRGGASGKTVGFTACELHHSQAPKWILSLAPDTLSEARASPRPRPSVLPDGRLGRAPGEGGSSPWPGHPEWGQEWGPQGLRPPPLAWLLTPLGYRRQAPLGTCLPLA